MTKGRYSCDRPVESDQRYIEGSRGPSLYVRLKSTDFQGMTRTKARVH